MEKTTLNKLKKKVFLRSALIPLDNLESIFELNETFSADEVLGELFLKSLRDFEYHFPLVWEDKIQDIGQLKCCCGNEGLDGYYKICDNFQLYVDCMISEDQIILVPNTTPKIRYMQSYVYPGSYTPVLDYQRPYVNLGNFVGTSFYLRGLCSRPIINTASDNSGSFGEKDAIYWMNIDDGMLGNKFVDQCMVNILEYVRNLKGNLTMPNYSVDLFGAVDVAYQQLKQDLDQFYLQGSWRGDLLV